MTKRIHGVDTHWGNLVYCQRPADDRNTFNDNWDRIFGKKDQLDEQVNDTDITSEQEQN